MNHALIFAGGTGIRMNTTGKPKQFLELYGKPIIIYTLEIFDQHPDIDTITIPCVAGWESYLTRLIEKYDIRTVTISILPADLPMSAMATVTNPSIINGMAKPRN